MGKYIGMFCLGFIVIAGIILLIAGTTGAPGISGPSWLLAILCGLIVGVMCAAVSLRKDGH